MRLPAAEILIPRYWSRRGVYEVAALPEDHRDFFYFNLDSGQEAQVSVKFNQAAGSNYGTNVGFNLYDSERRQLRNDFGAPAIHLNFPIYRVRVRGQ